MRAFDVDGIWLCCVGAAAGQERHLTAHIDCFFKREVKGESKAERWSRFGHYIVAVVAQCVQASSRETYETGLIAGLSLAIGSVRARVSVSRRWTGR